MIGSHVERISKAMRAASGGLAGLDATAVKLSAMFAALFVIYGTQLTYLPVWLDARGLTAAQIAFVTSTPTFLRLIVSPSVAVFADRWQAHRKLILALCWTGLSLLLMLSQLGTPTAIMIVAIAMLLSVQSVMPLVDTITMRVVRDQGLDYGRMRLWGSASFVLASYLAGFCAATGGAGTIVWLLVAGAALTTAAALALPKPSATIESRGAARLTLAGSLSLARSPSFLVFILAAGAIQASHGLFYVFGVLHWRAQGLSAGAIGSLWAISVVAEIMLFWWSSMIMRAGPGRLIVLGAVAGLVRWTGMAFDPPVALLFPLQILHAGSFAATHLGAMHWIARSVPDHQAGTAQALLSTITGGIGMGGAILLSGWLYPAFGGAGYLGMAALCALGGAAALALHVLPRPAMV